MSDWAMQIALLLGQAVVGGAATIAVRMLGDLREDLEAIEDHLRRLNGQVATTSQRLSDHEVLCTERHDAHRRELGIWRRTPPPS
jgi:hypothetical protein